MTSEPRWTQEAVQFIRYAMAHDDANGDALIEVAKSEGDLEGLTKAVAMVAVEAFRVGFGSLAGPLLAAALKETRRQR